MTDEADNRRPHGLVRTLLAPLRAPQRVVGDIESIAAAVLSLQHDARDRLASIDERAGALARAVAALQAPLNRIDRKATELTKLEQVITLRMDALREDLNTRMVATEEQVHGLRAPIERMSRDLAAVRELLPNPADGPLARLKDTLTSN